MRTTISSVSRNEIDLLANEFFSREFKSRNLGKSPRLNGVASSFTQRPIDATAFKSILKNVHLGDRENPVAWRLVFESGRSATTLWALGDKGLSSRIELAHGFAVAHAMHSFEKHIIPNKSASLSFAFQSGTGENQIPYLHTDVILVNRDFASQASENHLTEKNLLSFESMLGCIYAVKLGFSLRDELGAIDSSSKSDVKRCLFSGFQKENETGKFYQGAELFSAWKKEANEKGFGPNQVDSVLRHAEQEHQDMLRETNKCDHGGFAKARTTLTNWVQKKTLQLKNKGSSHEQ